MKGVEFARARNAAPGDSIRLNPGDLAWSSTSRFRRSKPNPDPAPGIVVEEPDPSLFEGRLDTRARAAQLPHNPRPHRGARPSDR